VVVVVDDYRDSAESLARLLARSGHQSQALFSCNELFSYLVSSSDGADLIVLDLHMPDIDGLECLRQLKAHRQWRDIPVVMYSADFQKTAMEQAMAAGARDFVVKGTVGWNELLGILEKHIANA
jgi:PleD family two-component response regulator